jgi:hypothetical protein
MVVAIDLDRQLDVIAQRLLLGKAILCLGRGAILRGPKPTDAWQSIAGLPSRNELSAYRTNRLSRNPRTSDQPAEQRDLVPFVGAVLRMPATGGV